MLFDLPNKGPWYDSWARCLQGALLIASGDVDDGVQALRPALWECQKLGPTWLDTIVSVTLAEALGAIGHTAAALTLTDEALSESEATGARWYVAEQLRVKGEVTLLGGAPNAVAHAESCFRQALERSRQQGALSWELRAATSLARLRQQQGRIAEALAVIQPVFERFTEGFGTADLRAASTLIRTLTNIPPT